MSNKLAQSPHMLVQAKGTVSWFFLGEETDGVWGGGAEVERDRGDIGAVFTSDGDAYTFLLHATSLSWSDEDKKLIAEGTGRLYRGKMLLASDKAKAVITEEAFVVYHPLENPALTGKTNLLTGKRV